MANDIEAILTHNFYLLNIKILIFILATVV